MERTVRTFALDCAEPCRLTGCGNGENLMWADFMGQSGGPAMKMNAKSASEHVFANRSRGYKWSCWPQR